MEIGLFTMYLSFLVLVLVLIWRKKPSKNLPPSPPKLPFIGNLHQLGSLPHQSLWRLAKKHGPVLLLHFGSVRTVVLSSAEAAKAAMKTHDLQCCTRPPMHGARLMTYNFQDIAFSPYGEYWRKIKKICVAELFSVKRVQSYQSIREEEVAKLIDSITDHISTSPSSPIEIPEKMFALTASMTFRIVFGTRFQQSDLNHCRFQEVVLEASAAMGSFCAAEFFPYVGWIVDKFSGLQRRREKVFRELDSFLQGTIDAHRRGDREKQEHEDIVTVLLRVAEEKSHSGASFLAEKNVKAILFDMFLGGVETSAITMMWGLAELVKRPELMKKAQDEIRGCIGNKEKSIVQTSDIEQFHYFKMIVKETLRLHAPGPLLLPRETISTMTINDYEIPPKTMLQVNAWGIGRDPKYWKDPEEFIPERFQDSSVDFRGNHFELLPFGSGRRSCPGIHMGTAMVEIGLANLLYRFDWKLPDGMKEEDMEMEEGGGAALTVSKKTPLNLVPIMKHI